MDNGEEGKMRHIRNGLKTSPDMPGKRHPERAERGDSARREDKKRLHDWMK